MILRVLALLAFCFGASLPASQETFEGKPLRKIEFVPPEQPLAAADLQRELALPLGEPVTVRAVSDAIKRLYATLRYEDIIVEAGLEGNGVVLTFRTTPAWFVGRVSVSGVPEPPNPGQLANATNLNLGRRYEPSDLGPALEDLVELLKSNGFYGAKISTSFEKQPRFEQIDLHFDVDPGKRAYFAPPVFSGDLIASPEKLVRITRWRRWWGYGSYVPFTETRAQQGIDRLRKTYREKEFLTSRIVLSKLDYNPATNRVSPYVAMDEGPKIQIRTEGAKLSQRKLKQLVPVYQELAVDKTLLTEGARNIEQYLQVQGYFDAQVDFEIGKVENNQQLIDYVIDRGERYKLVHIGFHGNKYFDVSTLRERLYIRVASLLQYRYGRLQ